MMMYMEARLSDYCQTIPEKRYLKPETFSKKDFLTTKYTNLCLTGNNCCHHIFHYIHTFPQGFHCQKYIRDN
jgi:hypothetical protein